MTGFVDGPAKGKTLMLKRAPYYLRVTECNGKFDALNELADVARADENLFAYHMTGTPGMCHVNAGRGRSGWYVIATYEVVVPQPTDEEMRDNGAWGKWCAANKPKDFPKP